MLLFDWIFRRARAADDPPPMPERIEYTPQRIHYPKITPAAPRSDEPVEVPPPLPARTVATDTRPTAEVVPVDPAVFAMDYTDSSGNASRRRVKLLGVTNYTSPPWINAICFERRAVRTFRLDRIQHIISLNDGTVHDPAEYLVQIAGIPPDLLGQPDNLPLAHARLIRDKMRAPLSILALAALEDGKLHPKEIDAIMTYAEKELNFLVREGWIETGNKRMEMVILRDMVANMRPAREDLQAYVKTIRQWESSRRMKHLTEALLKVVHADGEFTLDERNFLHLFNDFGTR